MKRTARTTHTRRRNPFGIAASVLIAGAVIVTATPAQAAPSPDEIAECPPNYDFVPVHCRPHTAPIELAGPFAGWFSNLAEKAGGN